MSGSPEELLRSALEKIVFFECRVASLEHELEAARGIAARAREDAQAARRREGELDAVLAHSRREQAVSAAQAAELGERVRLLEAERERFLSGMVERARVAGAPAVEGGDAGSESDLAGFISELRAEIETLRAWKRAAEAGGIVVVDAAASANATPNWNATSGVPNPSGSSHPRELAPRQGELGEGSNANANANASSPSPRVRGEGPSAAPTPIPRRDVASVSTLASRMGAEGRLRLDAGDARALSPAFATRSERALYERSLDDLGSTDAAARRRAADCLRVLGSSAAAPLLAAALGREPDGGVKAALLAALGALAEPAAADLAARELDDPRPAVRGAALDAAAALGKGAAVPHLARALADPSALVRRRAAVLLGLTGGTVADDALAAALSDADAGVARAAAAALSGRPTARAQGALAKALDHRDPAVRAAASRAVARWAGEAPDVAAPQDERRRASRRIAERLLDLDGAALRSAVTRVRVEASAAVRTSTATATATANTNATSGVPNPAGSSQPRERAPRQGELGEGSTANPTPSATRTLRAAQPRAVVAVAAAEPDPSLSDAALAELRAALRGRTPDELASALGRDRPSVEAALAALVRDGRAARRGPRFYTS